jgi:hypothetical protein
VAFVLVAFAVTGVAFGVRKLRSMHTGRGSFQPLAGSEIIIGTKMAESTLEMGAETETDTEQSQSGAIGYYQAVPPKLTVKNYKPQAELNI